MWDKYLGDIVSNLFKKRSEGNGISAVVTIEICYCIPHWLIGMPCWLSHSPGWYFWSFLVPFLSFLLQVNGCQMFISFFISSCEMTTVAILLGDFCACTFVGLLPGVQAGLCLYFSLVGSWRKIPFLRSYSVRNLPFGCQPCWYKTTQFFQAKLGT